MKIKISLKNLEMCQYDTKFLRPRAILTWKQAFCKKNEVENGPYLS